MGSRQTAERVRVNSTAASRAIAAVTRFGLKLTPAERLRWLEQTLMELRTLEGRARQGCADNPKTDVNRTEG